MKRKSWTTLVLFIFPVLGFAQDAILSKNLSDNISLVVSRIKERGEADKQAQKDIGIKTVFGSNANTGKFVIYNITISDKGVLSIVEEVKVPKLPEGIEEGVNSPFQLMAGSISGKNIAYSYKVRGSLFLTVISRDDSNKVTNKRTEKLVEGRWNNVSIEKGEDGRFNITVGNSGAHKLRFSELTSGEITRVQ